MSKNKFEQLIEFIINEDEAKAKALFHQIVVEKSRDIYEGLQAQEMGGERLGRQIEGHNDVIDGDEIGEAEDEFGGDELGGDEFGDDEMGDDEMEVGADEFGDDEMDGAMGDDMGSEADLDTRVMDLEDAIDELKAEFDELMGDGDGDDDDAIDIEGSMDQEGAEEFADNFPGGDDGEEGEGTDELGDEDDAEGDMKFGEASIYGGQGNSKTNRSSANEAKEDKKAKDAKAKKEKEAKAAKDKKKTDEGKSPADLMREYVEKVGQNWPKGAGDGDPVGSGGTKSPINSKSPMIGGKNDMGGTTANIAKGGTASDKDSNTGPKKPSNAYTKGYKDKQQAKTKEGSDTAGSQTVNKKSFNPGGKPGFRG